MKEVDILTLSMKAIVGEELTEDEKRRLAKRNTKYELVRYLYMEKKNSEADPNGPQLTNFQFSPGDGFEDMPTIDVVNSLLSWDEAIKNGDIEVTSLSLEDFERRESNPPVTGKKKRKLGDIFPE